MTLSINLVKYERIVLRTVFAFAFLLISLSGDAQDSVYVHNTKRAAIWSACIPGAGQIYNEIGYRKHANKNHRAWWKVPIIYGAFGVTGYYLQRNFSGAKAIKKEILIRRDKDSINFNPELSIYQNETQLINGTGVNSGFDEYSKNRDLLIFAFGGIWLIQVIEASVDAHFVTFDVSDKLSFNWRPNYNFNTNTIGLNLSLNF